MKCRGLAQRKGVGGPFLKKQKPTTDSDPFDLNGLLWLNTTDNEDKNEYVGESTGVQTLEKNLVEPQPQEKRQNANLLNKRDQQVQFDLNGQPMEFMEEFRNDEMEEELLEARMVVGKEAFDTEARDTITFGRRVGVELQPFEELLKDTMVTEGIQVVQK